MIQDYVSIDFNLNEIRLNLTLSKWSSSILKYCNGKDIIRNLLKKLSRILNPGNVKRISSLKIEVHVYKKEF